jgi:hypothetical protein
MPLKTLVVIAMRFYAIYWFIESISELLLFLPTIAAFQAQLHDQKIDTLIYLVIPIAMLGIAIFLWIIASRLSSQITKGHDTQLDLTGLTKEDLYSFAFVFLGLYFFLSSISAFMQRAYQFFYRGISLEEGNPQKMEFLYQLSGPAITLLVGLLCVLGAKGITRKLIRLQNKNENSTGTTPTT